MSLPADEIRNDSSSRPHRMTDTTRPSSLLPTTKEVWRSFGIKLVVLVAGVGVSLWWVGAHPPPSPAPTASDSGRPFGAQDPTKAVFSHHKPVPAVLPRQEPPRPGQAKTGGAPPRRVDLNRGTMADLQTLPGIGPVLAERIVEYRRSHGPFYRLEHVAVVEGIGPKRLARLKPLVTVTPDLGSGRQGGT